MYRELWTDFYDDFFLCFPWTVILDRNRLKNAKTKPSDSIHVYRVNSLSRDVILSKIDIPAQDWKERQINARTFENTKYKYFVSYTNVDFKHIPIEKSLYVTTSKNLLIQLILVDTAILYITLYMMMFA